MREARLLLDCKNRLGESPVWDERRNCLFWSDIEAREVHALHIDALRHDVWPMPGRVGSLGLCESGRLILAMENRILFFDPESGAQTPFLILTLPGPQSRLNDGKTGPDGAFWVGTMDERKEKEDISCLYRISPDGRVEIKIDGFKISNGLAFAPDGRGLYHADTRGPWIDRWDLDPQSGAISGRRRFADLSEEEGRPDGGACDAAGFYWSAGISAQCLNCFAPDGRLAERIPLPVVAPTMPCFGGADRRTLFVTSLREGRDAALLARYPFTGGILALEVETLGVRIARFRDI